MIEPLHPWRGRKWAALGTSNTIFGAYTFPLAHMLDLKLTDLSVGGGSLSTSAGSDPGGIFRRIADIPADTELVTIEAGMVDFRSNAVLGALYDTTVETFYGAIYAAIMEVLAPNPKRTLVFLTPFETLPKKAVGNWLEPNGNGDRQAQFIQAILDVCGWCGVPVIDVGRGSGIGGPTASLYLPDGTHLNPAGGLKMAGFIFDHLAMIRPYQDVPGDMQPGDGVWTLRHAVLEDMSGLGIIVTNVDGGHEGGVDFTRVAPYFFSSLWLASGSLNAIEFAAAPSAGTSLWITLGQGEAGWVAAGDFGDPGLYKLAVFDLATGDVTFGPALSGRHSVDPNVAGMRWRVARRNDIVEMFHQRDDGLWVAVGNPIDLAHCEFAKGYFEESRLGVLASHGTARDVRVGSYT